MTFPRNSFAVVLLGFFFFNLILNFQLFLAHTPWISAVLLSSFPLCMHCLLMHLLISASVVTCYLNRGFHPGYIYSFYMLEMLSESIHSRTAAISCFSQETEATSGASGHPFLYKKRFIGTVNLGLIENLLLGSLIENLLLSAEVKTDRYHFKNKILGNEKPRKRLVTLAGTYESMFILATGSQKQVHFYRLYRLD